MDKRTINIEGGDYAEGNIDQRQGAFVSGGTVRGSVIGHQTIYQTLPNWLRLLSAFAIVVILVVLMLGAMGGMAGIRAQLDVWGIMPEITPEQPGETLLELPHSISQARDVGQVPREIQKEIQDAAKDAGLTNLRVELAKTTLLADDCAGAEQLGAHYNASLVVWGEDTGVRVTVNFLNRRGTPKTAAQAVPINEATTDADRRPASLQQLHCR